MAKASRNTTPIPNEIIDKHIANTKPEFILVYLYGQRHSRKPRKLDETAEDLGLREEDVLAAWDYWEKAGLARTAEAMDGQGSVFEPAAERPPDTDAPYSQLELNIPENEPVRSADKPSYSTEEIERVALKCDDVRYLFKMAEKVMGKALTYNDMNMLLGFHDWLELPVQVIEVLLDYCVSNNHRSGRYLEKVAMDWADNGITTVDEAEAYIKTFNTDYREIMKSFGMSRRDPSPKETAFMRKWLRELHMPLELITEACGRSVIQTGGPKFSYADKILINWYENEVKTLADAQEYDEEFRKDRGSGQNQPRLKTMPKRKSRFADYKGRDWDYEKLERLASEYMEKTVN